jgi:outer membrane receptor protein involved in Fe transport
MQLHKRSPIAACAIGLVLLLLAFGRPAAGQGVTTGTMTGVVKDAQAAVVPGVAITVVHVPSGTTYETVTQSNGRFFIDNMRVGGPYKVTATLAGFNTEVQEGLTVSLGVSTDIAFSLKLSAVSETVTVVGKSDVVFSSSRTGAATAVLREDLAMLPTVSGRLNDITRVTPQAGYGGTFSGQDNRLNNITVDGSYFNNSFGLGGQPGDRTGVAPISLEAIEQVQVSVAPFDVRQGNFVGAGVNTVTRSGSNRFTGSVYYRYRNDSYVGKESGGLAFNPGDFKTTDFGEWAGGPVFKNKLFFFESYESQKDTRPLTTYTSNPGGAAAVGNMTKVLASDLTALSSFLSAKFNYDTGPFDNIMKTTPGKPFLMKFDYNLNGANRITFRYNMLNSETPVNLSSSSSLGYGRQTFSNNFLNFKNSNYSILENIRSAIGEWNSVVKGTLTNSMILGYTKQDESRGDVGKLFPFVDILDGATTTYTSIGSEPFTPNNELRYNTFQLQDSFTKFGKRHSLTFGAAVEKYHSENVYFPGKQSSYTYKSLADFYTAANQYLTDPTNPVSPVPVQIFQVRYMNIPGMDKPIQPLDVWYTSLYAQDQWRPRSNVTVTGGLRVDIAKFGDTAYDNPAVDALTFRDQNGNPVQYNTGALPKASPLWSPRVGFNWDVFGDHNTQVRGGTGVFTGKPAYVWISNQIGNTGMLTGLVELKSATTAYPFNPNPDTYKPKTVTGAPAASVDLAVTDPSFKFPQTWRSNIGFDQKLLWGLVGTVEFIYNRDVNGIAYINANLPAAQSAFTAADNRPRWVGTACATSGQAGGCVTRINNATGNQIVQAIVLQNQDVGRSWNFAATLAKPFSHGFQAKGAYSYGVSRNTVDPGSVAAGSWYNNPIVTGANTPALAYSSNSPGHRVFIQASYTKDYFKFGATTVTAYFQTATYGNTSYIFSGDGNGDGQTANDLIYIPRSTSEMNFVAYTLSASGSLPAKTFSAAEQAAAFDAYISQDKYLSKHRGEYAQRGALFYPLVSRMDLSFMQDLFHSIKGMKHAGQIRLDITNFGNLLNHGWGQGYATYQNRILTNPVADANSALSYRMNYITTATDRILVPKTFQRTAGISDVYVMMLSFRYSFQ